MTAVEAVLAEARTDRDDHLVAAGEPLAGLQRRCGGELPGMIAVPALLALVRKARRYGLPMARAIAANDGQEAVTAWVEVRPDEDYGTHIVLRSWQVGPLAPEDIAEAAERRVAIERAVAELTARLDAAQNLLSFETDAPDLVLVAETLARTIGRPWTEAITIAGNVHRQPLHWRLLDGAAVEVPGSDRHWRAALHPVEIPGREPVGFELCLLAETPLPPPPPRAIPAAPGHSAGVLGRDVAPVLREPIGRIIANAAAIRTRSAGPLTNEYARYASDIEAAGEHLRTLIEDLADLETVEDDAFVTAHDRIDLAEAARSAAQILAARAAERAISIDAPHEGEHLAATGEFRRVLQILLNLVGNAVRYTPEGSSVWIRTEGNERGARVVVADQGTGLSPDQQARVFDKFERLGRSDEGGTGLGLYISRRLARAMGGDLTVESAPGQGARFILELPAGPIAAV